MTVSDYAKLPGMIMGPMETAADMLDQIGVKAKQAKAKLAGLKGDAQ